MSRKASWCFKCVGFMTFTVAFLVTGIVFYSKEGPATQIRVIKDEVSLWDLGAIVDVALVNKSSSSNGSSCPGGYSLLTGSSESTKSYCKNRKNGKLRELKGEECSRYEDLIEGLGSLSLLSIRNYSVCFKRDENFNYHSILANDGLSSVCTK